MCLPFALLIVIYLRYNKLRFKYIIYVFTVLIIISIAAIQNIPSLNARYHTTIESLKVLDQSIENDEFHGTSSITIRYNFIKYGFLAFLKIRFWEVVARVLGKKWLSKDMMKNILST